MKDSVKKLLMLVLVLNLVLMFPLSKAELIVFGLISLNLISIFIINWLAD